MVVAVAAWAISAATTRLGTAITLVVAFMALMGSMGGTLAGI